MPCGFQGNDTSDDSAVSLTPAQALVAVVVLVILIVLWRARRAC